MREALQRRVREIRGREAIRRWEYRQRRHSKGVWFRLRRLLAEAETAIAITDDELARLRATGIEPQAVGAELMPPKQILLLDAGMARSVVGEGLPLRLDARLLASKNIVLIRFESA